MEYVHKICVADILSGTEVKIQTLIRIWNSAAENMFSGLVIPL